MQGQNISKKEGGREARGTGQGARGKRAQSQVIDMMIAFAILFIALITIFFLFNFYSGRLQENIFREDLHEKAFTFTDVLLSEGKPKDWNYSNVQIIGLAKFEGHLEPRKFDALRGNISYANAKNLSGLNGFEFYINMTKFDGSAIGGYGSTENLSGKEVISLRRVVFYGSDNAKMEVRVWRGGNASCGCTLGARRCSQDGSAIEECMAYPTCWAVIQQCPNGCTMGQGPNPAPACNSEPG